MPGWLRTSLVIAAVVGGAVLLWVGLALLVAILLVAAIPLWIWSRFAGRRAPEGPITLEGSATRVEETAPLSPGPDEKKERRDGSRER